MDSALAGRNIVLGVTGSIACYKALDLASKLAQAGANVETMLSYGATQFVTPLAFRSLTHRSVVTDTFDAGAEHSVEHVALARWAELVVIAPATVHCIAKLAARPGRRPADDYRHRYGGAAAGGAGDGRQYV